MRISHAWLERRYERLTNWHRWFAWRPVSLDGETIWLETVERKGEFHCGGFGDCIWFWQYRPLYRLHVTEKRKG
ncbi:hypothetical protein J2X36_002129 [Methylobacterium sp. BE186]|nr:hypothetical protein [Methylobacterium sp. BE186]